MTKKTITITILTILTLAIAVGGFWYVKNQQKENVAIKEKQQEEGQKQEQEQNNNQQNIKELEVEDIDTSNWKEYCNKEYGFCVKYPEGWEVQENYINNSKEFDFVDRDNNFIIFSVSYYKNWTSLGWQSKEKDNLEEYVETSKVTNINALYLDNEKAYSAIFKNTVINYEELFIMAEHNKHIYRLSFRNTTEMKKIQKEILKTFKFIN